MSGKKFFNLTGIFLACGVILFFYIASAATPLTIETFSSDNENLENN